MSPRPEPAMILETLGCAGATEITPVTGGRDAAIWRVRWGGSEYALRVLRAEQSEVARREVTAMGAAREAGLPVPEVVRFSEWEGRPAQLIAWVPGETALSVLQREPERVGEIGTMLGRMLATLHAITAPRELETLPHAPGKALLHQDFHPLNVLMDGSRVTGVIDWTDTCAGNPLADVAQSITLISVAPIAIDVAAEPIQTMRASLVKALVSGYESLRGPLPAESEMAPFYVRAAQRMLATMETRSHQPESGITSEHLETIRAWIARHAAN